MAINNIADLFVATLEQAGVKRIYGMVGAIQNAIRAAVGLRVFAVVAMPGDIAFRSSPKRALSTNRGLALAAPKVVPQADELKALADLLDGAERITLFCGRGCAGAHAPLMQLA